MRVAACNNPECTSATINALDTRQVSAYTSIVVGVDGNPVIAYHNDARDLLVATCGNATCAPYTGTNR